MILQEAKPQIARPPRANVLGVGVHAINMAQTVDLIEAAIDEGTRGYICVTGVHGIMEAQRNPELATILNRALLVLPDGMPTVWVGHTQGFHDMGRVFGPELMLNICARSVAKGYSHLLYGGDSGVADQLRDNLRRWYPGIKIVGAYSPPFRPLSQEEERQLVHIMERAKPDITWIGISTPKQENFMAKYNQWLPATLMIGVGAAFDLHTGRIQDAPQWMKQSGLQWVHRLAQDPRRLWKRYLLNNPRFLIKIALQLGRVRSYPLDAMGGSES